MHCLAAGVSFMSTRTVEPPLSIEACCDSLARRGGEESWWGEPITRTVRTSFRRTLAWRWGVGKGVRADVAPGHRQLLGVLIDPQDGGLHLIPPAVGAGHLGSRKRQIWCL